MNALSRGFKAIGDALSWDSINKGFDDATKWIMQQVENTAKATYGGKGTLSFTPQVTTPIKETVIPAVEETIIPAVENAGKTVIDGANNVIKTVTDTVGGVSKYLPLIGAGAIGLLLLSRR